jgi:hypothetical protein
MRLGITLEKSIRQLPDILSDCTIGIGLVPHDHVELRRIQVRLFS